METMFALATLKQQLASASKTKLFTLTLIGVAMIGAVFTILTPNSNKTSLSENFDGTLSRFSDIVYKGGSFTTPKEMVWYEKASLIPESDLQNQLLQSFGAIPDEEEPNVWYVENARDSAVVLKILSPTRFSVMYNSKLSDQDPFAQPKADVAINTPEEAAFAWTERHLFERNLVIQREAITYFSGGPEARKTTKNLAEIVEIPFAQMVGQFPIRSDHVGGYPLTVWVSTKTNEVLKVTFFPSIYSFSEELVVQPLTIDQVVENINQQKNARIIWAQQATDQPFSLERIRAGELTKANLEYRLISSNKLVPFYHFEGIFQDANKLQIEAEIVIPAFVF